MKKVFSETERRRLKKAQLRLLKDDLESASIMIREKKYRSAYILLFDALERILDIWFLTEKRVKPSNRKEREELIFRYFTPNILRKFKSFYYERRGGMYEDFLLIGKKDFNALLKFLERISEEIDMEIGGGIKEIVKEFKESL